MHKKPLKTQREPQGTWFMHQKPLKTQREPQGNLAHGSKNETLQKHTREKNKENKATNTNSCCMSVLCYSPILFGSIERGVYILRKCPPPWQLGGVVAICNPSGGRKVRSWDCLWGHRGRVEGASSPSPESPAASGRRTGCRGRCRERQRVRRATEQRLLSAPGSGGTACLNVSR